ncbi:single-stranded DNA-binding protein [Leifsonia sp. 21MFCrub1.1]|uniref:single-stranded DNA-binding protein n=1 Tax=Leifsonia sp. 21MFCrub1.1 TaxID=1798223 RepID=UPI0008928677|nr:single-stranded DNA-binding protein [Leifsonia sp. 21MFCrub1.1]SEA86948.1 single-strand DNA-binding protein [Leifsonia sp. 21MFCrub1.1]
MSDTVAVRGFVATKPRHVVTEGGLPITSFRLVTTHRRYNREASSWEDGESNWYTVSAFRRLALGAAASVAKGDPVLVAGRLCLREWTGGKQGMTVEIEAESIGHDLTWGRSRFTRAAGADPASDAEAPARADPSPPPPEGPPEGIPAAAP